MNQDNLIIAGKSYTSRLLVGTGKYKDFASANEQAGRIGFTGDN